MILKSRNNDISYLIFLKASVRPYQTASKMTRCVVCPPFHFRMTVFMLETTGNNNNNTKFDVGPENLKPNSNATAKGG